MTRSVNRRADPRTVEIVNIAATLERSGMGRLAATHYALRNGAPAHVVKRVLHDGINYRPDAV